VFDRVTPSTVALVVAPRASNGAVQARGPAPMSSSQIVVPSLFVFRYQKSWS
jgi:hypothetical protein